MGLYPTRAEPDIWMTEKDSLYEDIDVYVDNVAIVVKDPKEITDILTNKHTFKLNGT